MKILMITHLVPYPPSNGAMIRNFNLLKRIAKNHEVDLITFNQAPHFASPEELERGVAYLRQYCRRIEVFDIPTDRHKILWYLLLLFNIFSSTPYAVWRFSSKKMKAAVEARLRNEQYDVMEIGTIDLAPFARLAPDLPKILVNHNIESQLLKRRSRAVNDWFSRIYIRYQAWKLARYEARCSDLFEFQTTCSEEDKAILQAACPGAQVVVVPNGVDIEFFQPSEAPVKPRTLVFVGGTKWFPNRDGIHFFKEDIWPILKKRLPEIEFVAVGKQVDSQLAAFAQKNSTFRLLGFVDDIRPHVAEAAVFIVPLRIGGGTRLKILDAMAMGKAIVSTTIGAEGIKCEHDQDIIIADSPEEFAARIMELFDNEEKSRQLGKMARLKAEKIYSWDIIALTLQSAYEQAICRHKS